jgi:hypothetical protein
MSLPERAERLLAPQPDDVGCDETFELIDRFVDLLVTGGDPSTKFASSLRYEALEALSDQPRSAKQFSHVRTVHPATHTTGQGGVPPPPTRRSA